MAILSFDRNQVRELYVHAAKSIKHTASLGVEDQGPALLLVKDDGIYLMSNGLPQSKPQPHDPAPFRNNRVVYAEDYGPGSDLQSIRASLGGDDFVEMIPLRDIDADWKSTRQFQIGITPMNLTVLG